MSESITGLIDHLLHSRPTSTRPVHFPAVRPTFSPLVNTFSSSPLSPEPSLTCIGPSLGMSLSHLRPPHISWLSHHSQVCCSTASKKQVTHALSTAEAEYMALSTCVQEGLWLKSFLHSLHQSVTLPLHIHANNTAAISLAVTPSNCPQTHHISTCFHFV